MSTQRTVRHVMVAIDTEGLSEKEHERRVTWVEKNIQDAGRNIESAFVTMAIYDQDKSLVGIFGAGGTPTEEIREIAEEMFHG